MSGRRRVLVEVAEAAAEGVLEVLVKAGQIQIVDAPPPPETRPCAVCGEAADVAHMPIHADLGHICVICQTTAERLERQFRDAARKAYTEFRAQLAQLIRDARAGAPDPTFYRGFE